MKYLFFLLSIGFLAGPSLNAQECPDFKNMITLSDGGQLESPSAENKQKKKGLYRGFESSIRLEGEVSPVKLSGDEIAFIFRPIDAEVHPAQQIKLYPFEATKGVRELMTGGMNMFGGSKNKQNDDASINLIFEKIEDGCYLVKIDGNLPAGEYAFSIGTSGSVDVQGQGAFGTKGDQNWYAFAVK